MTTLLITGATRGLGLATARAAAARPGVRVLVAGRDPGRTRAAAAEAGGEPVHLDLGSLAAVAGAVAELPPIDALACNAGVQVLGPRRLTADGYEETFAVNHLAHLVLADALLAREDGPRRLVFLGSGTHDPAQRTGMPAPFTEDLATIAAGGPPGADDAAAGRRRYTTSKLLITATALGLAREHPDRHVTAFDPGLMPGTGLARDYPPALRVVWTTAMRALALLPFGSTPARSGAALAALLLDDPPPVPSGTVAGPGLRPARASARALDPAFQAQVLAASRELAAQPSRT